MSDTEIKTFDEPKATQPFRFGPNGEVFHAKGELSAKAFVRFAVILDDLARVSQAATAAAKAAKEAEERGDEDAAAAAVAGRAEQIEQQVDMLTDAVNVCMTADAATEIISRLAEDSDRPLSMSGLSDVLNWLMRDVYAMSADDGDDDEEDEGRGERPTPPESD